MNFISLFLSILLITGKYVQVIPPAKTIELLQGKETLFEMFLVPAEGIHLNGDPMPQFQILTKKSPLEIQVVKTPPQYIADSFSVLDSKKPFLLSAKIKEKIKTGSQFEEKIRVIYFYCSDQEGWCSQGTEDLTLQFRLK